MEGGRGGGQLSAAALAPLHRRMSHRDRLAAKWAALEEEAAAAAPIGGGSGGGSSSSAVPPAPPPRPPRPPQPPVPAQRPPRPARASPPMPARHGVAATVGRRKDMEDAFTAAPGFIVGGSGASDFFGVYDGHGGASVAATCRMRMHQVVAEEVRRVGLRGGFAGGGSGLLGWRQAMMASFAREDEEVLQEEEEEEGGVAVVGSTAVVVLVGERRIVVANCGDSRAVLSRRGLAIPLSFDHKPNRPDERERVDAAGGLIIDWNGYRVSGVLATSRAIGDHVLRPYVISVPEVTVADREDGDEFIILASDGLWDAMSNESACSVVGQCLSSIGSGPGGVVGSPAEAAALLVRLAVARGSNDNVCVIVVQLKMLDAAVACTSY